MAGFLGAALLESVGAAQAPSSCSPNELHALVDESPKDERGHQRRVALLSSALHCENLMEYPSLAAQAAYELSLFYAGATDASQTDLRQAIVYAQQSADLLSVTENRKTWFNVSVAAARLRFHAAQERQDLIATRVALESLLPQLPDASWAAKSRQTYYLLLVDINEQLFEQGDGSALAQALGAIELFLELDVGRRPSVDRAEAFETKARLIAAAIRSEEVSTYQLADAVELFEKAIAVYRALSNREGRVRTQVNLARTLVQVEDSNFGRNVERAIKLLQLTLPTIDQHDDRDTYCEAANALASAFMARQEGNRDQNMREATHWFRAAFKLLEPTLPKDQRRWVRSAVNLAMALEAAKINEDENLQEADDLLTEVVAWLEKRNRFEETVKPLAIQFGIRLTWAQWGVPGQLDAAGALLAKAEERAAGLSPSRRAVLQADKGDYFRARYAAGKDGALESAVDAYQTAITLTNAAEAPSIWASLHNNLGNACNSRERPDLYPCARDAYQQALRVRTESAMPREHADTLVNIANLEFENAHWQEAANLYASIAKRQRGMFNAIEGQDVLLRSVSQSKRWFERAAYALAQQDRGEEGLWIAEQGKMRLLKRKLGLKEVAAVDAGLRTHLSELQSAPGTVILVPIVTTKGSVVFALYRSLADWVVKKTFLNELSADLVVQYLQGGKRGAAAKAGWIGAYQEVNSLGAPDGSPQRWSAELRSSQIWLGANLVQPTFDWLHREGIEPTNAVWITQGELALLPIHAALMGDGKLLIEHMPVTYAPSLMLLRGAARSGKVARSRKTGILSVGNPTSDPKLLFSEAEARTAVSKLPTAKARLLLYDQASPTAVKRQLKTVRIFHFAGHASFDRDDPLKSHLLMSNQQRLTVAALQTSMKGGGPDLAILSACESGLIQVYDIANEFQGLPAAFLSLGTKGIISSLWPVKDGPTLFLIDRFMMAFAVEGKSASVALRDAQLWVRDASGEELAIAARRLSTVAKDKAAKEGLDKLARFVELKPQWKPYADPMLWAGLFYSGGEIYASRDHN